MEMSTQCVFSGVSGWRPMKASQLLLRTACALQVSSDRTGLKRATTIPRRPCPARSGNAMLSNVRTRRTFGWLGLAAFVVAAIPYALVVWYGGHSLQDRSHVGEAILRVVYFTVRALTWLPYHVTRPLGLWNGLGALFWDRSGGGEVPEESFWSFRNPCVLADFGVAFCVYYASFVLIEILRRVLARLWIQARTKSDVQR